MQKSPPEDRRGQWIDFGNAEEEFNIKSMKKMKKIAPLSMAFEHGDKVAAQYPYSKFEFVYTMLDAPPSWIASQNYSIRLRQWCRLCLYFSDESNRAEPEWEYGDLFVKYTGLTATVENIERAFENKLLISSSSLEQTLKDREAKKKPNPKNKKKVKAKTVTPKSVRGCCGVQSRLMDTYAPNDLQYCKDKGWYYKGSQWHAKDCVDTDLNDKGRCKKCNSLKGNFNKSRHPHLFQSSPPATASTAVETPAAKMDDIRSAYSTPALQSIIQNRLCTIEASEVPNDSEMLDAAKLLKMNNDSQVDVDSSNVFIVCNECSIPRVCQKRSTNVELCVDCQSKGQSDRWLDIRRKQHEDLRKDPHSNVGWKYRSNEELSAVSQQLNRERKCAKDKIDRMKKRLKDNETDMEMTEELLNHLESELQYAKNNKVEVKRGIKEKILEREQCQAARSGCLPGETKSNFIFVQVEQKAPSFTSSEICRG